MIDVKEFELAKYTREGMELIDETRAEFQKFGLDADKIPSGFEEAGEKIKLVFVGQYSAGKSSIIKMLSGVGDIKIGAAITTDRATAYPWNGIEIVDTPGIHTEMPSDHDRITYDQINRAAMLVFVITSQGFSQRIGDHFRELAVEQKRADNMVLVVNKMDMTSVGNTPEQQRIIAEDIAKVIAPYTPDKLYLSFVDTASYFESLEETDPELKGELLEMSGHDPFVDNLNRFVAEHEVLARLSKPLYTLAEQLRIAMRANDPNTDKDFGAFADSLDQKKRIIFDGKTKCLADVKSLVRKCKTEIEDLGRQTVEKVMSAANKEAAEKLVNDANARVETIASKHAAEINDSLQQNFAGIDTAINTYNDSEFVRKVNANIEARAQKELDAGIVEAGGVVSMLGGVMSSFGGSFLSQFAAPGTQIITKEVPSALNAIFGKIASVGTTAGLTYLGVPVTEAGVAGGLVGEGASSLGLFTKTVTQTVPLPPTLTQNIARFLSQNAARIGNVIAIAGLIWTLWSLWKGGKQANDAELERQAARSQFIANFDQVASEVSNSMFDNAKKWINENIDPQLQNFDKAIESIDSQQSMTEERNKKFKVLLDRTENLLSQISA